MAIKNFFLSINIFSLVILWHGIPIGEPFFRITQYSLLQSVADRKTKQVQVIKLTGVQQKILYIVPIICFWFLAAVNELFTYKHTSIQHIGKYHPDSHSIC